MAMVNPYELIDRRLSAIEQVLQELRKSRTDQSVADEIGGIELACDVTRLSRPRIYALVSQRAIPHAKRGNRLHFNRNELLAWVAEGHRAEKGGPDE